MKYWGSVRFFKHLIWLVILLAVFGSVSLGAYALHQNADLADKVDKLQHQNAGLDNVANAAPIAYQELYPELYSTAAEVVGNIPNGKVAYLTFADGPSEVTEDLLDVLDEYGVKATFFVTAQKADKLDLIGEIARRGHSVGVHSYTHKYRDVYKSVESFLADFSAMYEVIEEQTGVPPHIFRFPGGSVNAYNSGTYQELIAEMTRRGFVYYDWNATASDVDDYATVETITTSIINGAKQRRFAIIDCHDGTGRSDTVAAIGPAIEALQAEGYRFEALSPEVTPVHFNYKQEGH